MLQSFLSPFQGSAQCRVWSVAYFQKVRCVEEVSPRSLTQVMVVGVPRAFTITGPR